MRVWVLSGGRVGDLKQMEVLARRLDPEYELKRIRLRVRMVLNLVAILPVNIRDYGQLEPPWPDIVLTAEAAISPLARWIKRRSGGKVRIIHLGRPAGSPRGFDLVITTRQFRQPSLRNVLELPLPLTPPCHRGSDGGKDKTIAVLLGGSSPAHRLSLKAMTDLWSACTALAAKTGCRLRVSTSARTGTAIERALTAWVNEPHELYLYSSSMPNPFRSWLGEAERIVVTSDSVSMLADAVATGRPVHVFEVSENTRLRDVAVNRLCDALERASGVKAFVLAPLMALHRLGVLRRRPDRAALLRFLRLRGEIQSWPKLVPDERHAWLEQSLMRVRALVTSEEEAAS